MCRRRRRGATPPDSDRVPVVIDPDWHWLIEPSVAAAIYAGVPTLYNAALRRRAMSEFLFIHSYNTSTDSLARDIVSSAGNPDVIFELITALDEAQEEWGLTLRLAEYFDRQRDIYHRTTVK